MSPETITAIFAGVATLCGCAATIFGIWVQYKLKLIATNVQKVEIQTNSMHTAMVEKTEAEALQRGKIEGKAEEKAEEKAKT